MEKVFVSYRSGDASAEAMLVKERLDHVFGPETAFLDHRSIELGSDFQERLWATLRGCDASIVIIGPAWFDADHAGNRLVDRENDFVRQEIEVALARHRVVIPLLVRGAPRLTADMLPSTIRGLASRQYVRMDHRSEATGLDKVVERLTELLGAPAANHRGSAGGSHAGAVFQIEHVGQDVVNGPKTVNHYGR
jgi:hypothetical protein